MGLVDSFRSQATGGRTPLAKGAAGQRVAATSDKGFWGNVGDAINPFDRGGTSSQVRNAPGVGTGGTKSAVAKAPTPWWETAQRQAESARQNAIAKANKKPGGGFWITQNNQRDIDQMVGLLTSGYELDKSTMQDQINAIINSNSMRGEAFSQKEAAMRKQLEGQLAINGIDVRGIDLQLGNFAEWQRFLDVNRDNAVGQIAGNRNHAYGLKASAAQDRKLDEKDIGKAREGLLKQVERERRNALSDATVRGVVGSVGQDWGDIEDTRVEASGKLDSEDARSAKALADRQADLDNTIGNFNWDIKNANLSHEESTAKLKERKQLLELEAEKARLSAIDLQNAMGTALAQLGLNRAMSEGQFLESLANAKAADQQNLMKYLQGIANQQQQYKQWQEKAAPPAWHNNLAGSIGGLTGGKKKSKNPGGTYFR